MKNPCNARRMSGDAARGTALRKRPVLRFTAGGLTAVALSALILAEAATAQEQAVLEEIQVTGTRIQRTGMTTPTPVTMLDREELENMAPGLIIDSLEQLPQFLGSQTPQTTSSSVGSNIGASTLNMRALGSNRTLVLLDSRRLVPFNRFNTVDINMLPQALIQRVETVTGGASAAYGTDAVAGVTNFILDRTFTGVEGKLQGGVTSRGDAQNWEASLAVGTPIGERMHLIASAETHRTEEIRSFAGRDWYQSIARVTNPQWLETGEGPREITAPNVVATNHTCGGLINAPGTSIDRYEFLSDGTAHPFIISDLSAYGPGTTNTQSVAREYGGGTGCDPARDPNRASGFGSVYPELERQSVFAHLSYDVTGDFQLYAQGLFGQSSTEQGGSTHAFRGPWAGRIYQGNAYLPDEINQIMQNEGIESFGFERVHTSADIGNGRLEQRNSTFSWTGGFEANLNGPGFLNGWLVDGYYQYGKTLNRTTQIAHNRTDRLFLAMDAVRDPDTGTIRCHAALVNPEQYGDCVPINLFGAGNASQEAINWVSGPDKYQNADVQQHTFELNASGRLHDGWGAGEITGALGVSYRQDSMRQWLGPQDVRDLDVPFNDEALGIRGIPAGFTGDEDVWQFGTAFPFSGNIDVTEAYAETIIPLLSNVTGADLVEISLAARWADYSGSGSIWTHKFGFDYQPIDDLRFRGTVSRDVRAAHLQERFDRNFGGGSVDDPVLGVTQDISVEAGGNPNVNPEIGDTLTFGLVYQPSRINGLALSADWFQVDVKDAIGTLGTQRIVDDCHATGAPTVCDLITRDPVTNEIQLVRNVIVNIDQEKVSGVDLEASYRQQINLLNSGSESVTLRVLASRMLENSTTPLDAPTADFVGTIEIPKWRGTAYVNYHNGPLSLYVQQRYDHGGKIDRTYVEGVDVDINTVSALWYTNVGMRYDIDTANGGYWQLYGNVTNLFDQNPPVTAGWSSTFGYSMQTSNIYDRRGRRFTVGTRFQF